MEIPDGCHNCVFAYFDGGLWMRTLWSGFPAGRMCANHPDRPGRLSETRCRICPNYRRKPEEPGAEAKTIILTNGMIAYVDACDYEELSQYTWQLVSGGYAGRIEKRRVIFMHRQIMNPPKGMVVDHIHHNRLDNTRAHLRVCTLAENAQNRAKPVTATSRYWGVSYNKARRKWVVALPREGGQRYVGTFDDELEGARAYDYAAVVYLDDFARLNFPQEWPPERRAEVRAAYEAGEREAEKGSKTEGKSVRRSEGKGATPAKSRATRAEQRATKKNRRTEGRRRKTAAKGKGPKTNSRKARRATAAKRPRKAGGDRP